VNEVKVMAKPTTAELQQKLEQANKIIDSQMTDISRLRKEIEETRSGMNVVSRSEFDSLVIDLENMQEKYKALERIYLREKERLQKRIDDLLTRINERPEISTTVNARGAGRKEYQDIDIIKRIYSMYLEGNSLRVIAEKLNKEKIPTKAGRTWAKSSVRFILLNKTYVRKGIIDEKTFSLITERMAGKIHP
jgi:hypothetical protein